MSAMGNMILDIEERIVSDIGEKEFFGEPTRELIDIAESLQVPFQWVSDTYYRMLEGDY